IVFANGRLDDTLHLADIDAVARSRLPVRLDVEIQPACHLLWIDIARAFHSPHSVSNLTGLRFKFCQIRTEELDANLRPNTGREHIDAVDDRLCPDIRHTRQGNSAVHRALELRKGHARSPLIPRLEMLASAMGMNMMSPSLSGGMNSLPMPEARSTAPTRNTTATPSVMAR